MDSKRHISTEEARLIGTQLGIDWAQIDLEQFRLSLEVELERGAHNPEPDVTTGDIDLMGKIPWAHLRSKAILNYYTRLDQLKADAKNEN